MLPRLKAASGAPRRTPEPVPYTPAMRLLLEIAYDGSEFSGWQIQPGRSSVQGVLQEEFARLYSGTPIHLIGASRTDAGVHALGFAASYLSPARPFVPPERIPCILNSKLPPSIRIRSIREADLNFHTRYDAVGKAYTYVFNLGSETPFDARYSWRCGGQLDVGAMIEGSRAFVGTHDFSSFVVERSMIPEAVRTIYSIDFSRFGKFVCVTFKGSGFLYKMVRCLIGTLEAAGRGRLRPEECGELLAARDRSAAPETAPARGLFLNKVFFEEEELRAWQLRALPFGGGESC